MARIGIGGEDATRKGLAQIIEEFLEEPEEDEHPFQRIVAEAVGPVGQALEQIEIVFRVAF